MFNFQDGSLNTLEMSGYCSKYNKYSKKNPEGEVNLLPQDINLNY
jgi:hypothetical protein